MHYCMANALFVIFIRITQVYVVRMSCLRVTTWSHYVYVGSPIDCYLCITGVSGSRRGGLWHNMRSSVPRLF